MFLSPTEGNICFLPFVVLLCCGCGCGCVHLNGFGLREESLLEFINHSTLDGAARLAREGFDFFEE